MSSVTRPVKELRGFTRVTLQPGESKSITFRVGPDELSLIDRHMQRVVEPGRFDVMIGTSSATQLTATLGVVMQINNNLSASLDYYNVDITDAIAPLNSLFAYQQCFNANGSSNPTLTYAGSKYCALILRNVQSGERSSVDAPFINTGSLKTDGIDVAVNWRHDLGKGQFYINSLMTFLGKYDIQDAPGTPVVHEKDTLQTQDGGQYKYKVTNQFGYNFGGGKAGVALQWRYLPAIRDESLARTPTSNVFGVGSYQSFNLSASYTLNEKINLRMGIDNLTDEQPPVVGARPGDNNAEVTRADYYDILGRRAFVGVTARF